MWEAHGEDMARAVERHEAIIADATEVNGGTIVRSRGEGDSCFCVFPLPHHAVAAALAAQLGLSSEPWERVPALRVRMAIHAGTAQLRAGQYYGSAVNRCARLRGIAHGGQTLLSAAAADGASDALPPSATLSDLGSHRLPDLAQPERVFQLCHPDLPGVFPPVASLDALPNNLPVQLTRFVGRERELADVHSLLDKHRLVTLLGPGGSGKTRLAIHAAATLLESFPDGVWLVRLGGVADASLVANEIASTLGLREEAGRSLLETVAAYLRSRTALLVIDNCEHVIGAVSDVVAGLLADGRLLKIVATSRQALGVEGEVVRRLHPLTVPGEDAGQEELLSYESVQLLADRGALAREGFEITEANAGAVAQICRRLDGIPLAIEFAAARLGSLGPAELARRLDDRFRLLSQARRVGPERHQTLEAAVDWSYELLDDIERLLFRRLAVFAGRFTVESAEVVCADDELTRADVASLLSRLVDRSLVFADTQDEATSYRMLSTIRSFAIARLEESGEDNALRARHLDWFMELAEQAEPELVGADQVRWFDVLAAAHDDLRAALTWGLGADPLAAMRTAVALVPFWDTRGHWTEGRRWLENAIAAAPEPSVDLARALRGAANFAANQGETAEARAFLNRALALSRQLPDEQSEALTLTTLGTVAAAAGAHDDARRYFDEGLALIRRRGDDPRIVGMLMNLAMAALARGDEGAEPLFAEALALSREQGHKRGIAGALQGLASIAQSKGDIDRALRDYEESLRLFRELGDKMGTAAALSSLAVVARARGDLDEASRLLGEALPIQRELGDRRSVARALARLGTVAWTRGELVRAQELHTEALGVFRNVGDAQGVVGSLVSLARVARATGDASSASAWLGQALDVSRQAPVMRTTATCLEELAGLTVEDDPARAARLFGAAEAIRSATGATGPRTAQRDYERDVARVRERLGVPGLERAWAEGRGMSAAEAVGYASRVAVAH